MISVTDKWDKEIEEAKKVHQKLSFAMLILMGEINELNLHLNTSKQKITELLDRRAKEDEA